MLNFSLQRKNRSSMIFEPRTLEPNKSKWSCAFQLGIILQLESFDSTTLTSEVRRGSNSLILLVFLLFVGFASPNYSMGRLDSGSIIQKTLPGGLAAYTMPVQPRLLGAIFAVEITIIRVDSALLVESRQILHV